MAAWCMGLRSGTEQDSTDGGFSLPSVGRKHVDLRRSRSGIRSRKYKLIKRIENLLEQNRNKK